MIPGWRARFHWFFRQPRLLKTCALFLIGGGFASAWLMTALLPQSAGDVLDPHHARLRATGRHLQRASPPRTRPLSQWLRQFLPRAPEYAAEIGAEPPSWQEFQASGRIADFDVRALITRHSGEAEIAQALTTLVEFFLAPDDASVGAAAFHIQERSGRSPPVPLAAELHASVLQRRGDEPAAFTALMTEALNFPDATPAREDALRLALNMPGSGALNQFVEQPGWLASSPPWLHYRAGVELGDPVQIGFGLLRHRLHTLPVQPLLLALFAALLWYVILVLQTDSATGRWWRPLLPFGAGMVSIWPALSLAAWQENVLKMSPDAGFPHDLWYYIMGVGLREEAGKLLLALLLLPALLRRKSAGAALMTGAFIGLGFAFEENIDYYIEFGGAVALIRFLSANFMHAALSGMAVHALYHLVRSRFAHAETFLITFAAIVAAHGAYDWSASTSIDGAQYLTMVILAGIAWRFLDLTQLELRGGRQFVTPAAVFVLGVAVLIAGAFWMAAAQSGSREALYDAAQECLAILPVGFIYWRRLDQG